MTKRYCTVPDVLDCREWWEFFFGHLCKAHDEAYVATLNILVKLWSDAVMIYGMAKITIRLFYNREWRDAFGGLFWTVGATLALPTFGTIYWAFMRTKERSPKLQKLTDYVAGWVK